MQRSNGLPSMKSSPPGSRRCPTSIDPPIPFAKSMCPEPWKGWSCTRLLTSPHTCTLGASSTSPPCGPTNATMRQPWRESTTRSRRRLKSSRHPWPHRQTASFPRDIIADDPTALAGFTESTQTMLIRTVFHKWLREELREDDSSRTTVRSSSMAQEIRPPMQSCARMTGTCSSLRDTSYPSYAPAPTPSSG